MPHLTPVPDPDPAGYFTTVPVCSTCPPMRPGFHATRTAQDWEVTLWHDGPCPRAGEAPILIRVPGCPTCHEWDGADLSVSSLIPGRWAFIPKHGRTPLTSEDGTVDTASGGEYCPQLEADAAALDRLARRRGAGPPAP
jgi:hypothetical protein